MIQIITSSDWIAHAFDSTIKTPLLDRAYIECVHNNDDKNGHETIIDQGLLLFAMFSNDFNLESWQTDHFLDILRAVRDLLVSNVHLL